MKDQDPSGTAQRWARFRFAIIGPLLACPPRSGQLRDALEALAQRSWIHPTTGEPVRYGLSTIERWYYSARREPRDPLVALRKTRRSDAGQHALSEALRAVLGAQHREHPGWSVRLHYDNLLALATQAAELAPVPSYDTVRRFMRVTDLRKSARVRSIPHTAGGERAARRLDSREVRSYEVSHVHGLWHLDFHAGSQPVLTPQGEWRTPHLFGCLDDRSRLCCHLQWYLDETAETLVHGLSQALQKRALPRALMSDNGAAMLAAETVQGLEVLGVLHQTTLAYSPYQNGKQESFWSQVESRLMGMLESVAQLTLERLNEATQAWVELEYNKKIHQELGVAPVQRYLDGPDVGRPSPNGAALRDAFRRQQWRTQRRSDATVSIEGRRFEVPSRLRHQSRLVVRYARWDLSHINVVDPHNGQPIAPLWPLDKQRNSNSRRRALEPSTTTPADNPTSATIAPLLQQLMDEYAATGLAPAYLPKQSAADDNEDQQ